MGWGREGVVFGGGLVLREERGMGWEERIG